MVSIWILDLLVFLYIYLFDFSINVGDVNCFKYFDAIAKLHQSHVPWPLTAGIVTGAATLPCMRSNHILPRLGFVTDEIYESFHETIVTCEVRWHHPKSCMEANSTLWISLRVFPFWRYQRYPKPIQICAICDLVMWFCAVQHSEDNKQYRCNTATTVDVEHVDQVSQAPFVDLVCKPWTHNLERLVQRWIDETPLATRLKRGVWLGGFTGKPWTRDTWAWEDTDSFL